MKISELQKKTAQAIVNIFETGSIRGEYGQVTVAAGDSGHLTYGRSQTTLASGNLSRLIARYCLAPSAKFVAEMRPYLGRLRARDPSLDQDLDLRRYLSLAGKDPVMRTVQDAFFDEVYWDPAIEQANGLGLRTALGLAIVYDSMVHGSWRRMRDRTIARVGAAAGKEADWLRAYVETRRAWLLVKGGLLARTVYRMDTFRALLKAENFDLHLPLVAHGVVVVAAKL